MNKKLVMVEESYYSLVKLSNYIAKELAYIANTPSEVSDLFTDNYESKCKDGVAESQYQYNIEIGVENENDILPFPIKKIKICLLLELVIHNIEYTGGEDDEQLSQLFIRKLKVLSLSSISFKYIEVWQTRRILDFKITEEASDEMCKYINKKLEYISSRELKPL